MIRPLVTALVFSALALSARPAAAEFLDSAMYDTVDSFRLSGNILTITGIISGQSAVTTSSFSIRTSGDPARCDRLLMLVMSKPGKFQFGVVRTIEGTTERGCMLVARTP